MSKNEVKDNVFKEIEDLNKKIEDKPEFYIDKGKKDNLPIISFFATILSRIAYEPPLLYEICLVEIIKIFKKINIPIFKESSGSLYQLLKLKIEQANNNISNKQSEDGIKQKNFIDNLLNENDLFYLMEVGKMINQRITNLRDSFTKEQKNQGENETRNWKFENMTELFQTEFTSNENIKTIYIHTGKDENVFITAFIDLNTIFVTFRGTASVQNMFDGVRSYGLRRAFCDHVVQPTLAKNSEEEDQEAEEDEEEVAEGNQAGGFVRRILKQSLVNTSSDKNPIVAALGGVLDMLNSTIGTIMYSIYYLSNEFINPSNFTEQINKTSVYTFGHSLGGALSTLFAYEYVGAVKKLRDNKETEMSVDKLPMKDSIICITNASPRSFNKYSMMQFMDYVKKGKINYLRQWTARDWVVSQPFQKFDYYHPKILDSNESEAVEVKRPNLKFDNAYLQRKDPYLNYDTPLLGEANAKTSDLGIMGINPIAHFYQQYINYMVY